MDDIKRKIAALLNLAKGKGATEHEMQTAMAMAMKLADKHRYNLDEIAADAVMQQKEEAFIKAEFRTAEGEYRRPPCHKYITRIIERYLKVEVILIGKAWSKVSERGRLHSAVVYGSTIMMLGRESDVEFAKFTYNYLRETYNRLWAEYRKTNDIEQRYRDEFFEGVTYGLSNKLWSEQREVHNEIANKKGITDAAFTLMVVSEDDKRKSALKQLVPDISYNVTTKKGQRSEDGQVEQDGFDRGKEINLNRGLE